MTRRCGSVSRRFERKDRLGVQPVFFVYAVQFLPPDSSCSGYTCCLERLHIAVRCARGDLECGVLYWWQVRELQIKILKNI